MGEAGKGPGTPLHRFSSLSFPTFLSKLGLTLAFEARSPVGPCPCLWCRTWDTSISGLKVSRCMGSSMLCVLGDSLLVGVLPFLFYSDPPHAPCSPKLSPSCSIGPAQNPGLKSLTHPNRAAWGRLAPAFCIRQHSIGHRVPSNIFSKRAGSVFQ